MQDPNRFPSTSHGAPQSGFSVDAIKETAIAVITDPVSFYRSMPKDGGFAYPVVFLAAMAVVTALVGGLLSVLFGGRGASGAGSLLMLVLLPILVAVYCCISAAFTYLAWRMMGSEQGYETAFRCLAFAAAIMPVTALLGPIPYLGVILPTLWGLYLIVIASEHVHGIKPVKAWLVFGVFSGVLVLLQLGGEYAGRHMSEDMKKFEQRMEGIEDMSPQEARKAIGDFLKGMQDSLGDAEKPER